MTRIFFKLARHFPQKNSTAERPPVKLPWPPVRSCDCQDELEMIVRAVDDLDDYDQ
jgi:hypothetical protein